MPVVRCPYCEHESVHELAGRPKFCTNCGRRLPAPGETKAASAKIKPGYQQYLDEVLAHWQGTHVPEPDLGRITPQQGQIVFDAYQHDLSRGRYAPAYRPSRREKQAFAESYVLLKRGKRDLALDWLRSQTEKSPRFAEPWIWRAAATDDQAERIDCLETAILLEPTHPLARDAFSLASGRVTPAGIPVKQNARPTFRVIKCPQCAGALRYEPGATQVKCQFCDHRFELERTDLLEQQTELMGELRLTRRVQGTAWREANRISRCQSCGAELVMTHHLARQCLFCGSTSVLVEDVRQALIQPDGFLPFEIDQDSAVETIRRALGTLQRGAGDDAGAQRPQGIYLPYWVFDGFVEARYQPHSLEGVLAPNRQPEPYRRMLMFDNLLHSAMEKPFARLLESLLPYKLRRLVPYDAHLLADWTAALYRRDVEQVVDEAREAMLEAAMHRMRQSSPQAFAAWNSKRSFEVTSVTYQLVLLPVWTAVIGPRGRRALILVNGQTGELVSGSITRRRERS